MDEGLTPSKPKPRWVKPLSIFYALVLVPFIFLLGLGFAMGSGDKNFVLLISLSLLSCISLIVGIIIGFKNSNNLNFPSKSKKLMVAPIYLIIGSTLASIVADTLSSSLWRILGARIIDDDILFYILLIGCSVHYYFYYKKEV